MPRDHVSLQVAQPYVAETAGFKLLSLLTMLLCLPVLGVAVIHLAVVHADTASTPATLTALVVRWLIVWLPAAVLGVWWLALCLVVDGLTTWRSSDHRPLTLRLARTRHVTLESMDGANRSEIVEATP